MKIDVTTACSMGCRHCLSDCRADGTHGRLEDLVDAMDFCREYDRSGFVLLSGGEVFEHPRALEIIEEALRRFAVVAVATNGDRLSRESELYTGVRRLRKSTRALLELQVTNDPRYYPKPLSAAQECVLESLGAKAEGVPTVYPQGRALRHTARAEWATKGPKCASLRLLARQGVRDLGDLLTTMTAVTHKYCTPTLGPGREVRLGESALCPAAASIDDEPEKIVQRIEDCECRACREAVARLKVDNEQAARVLGWA